MVQLSIRIDEDLHQRARQVAASQGSSLNGFIARVLRIAVDPAADEPASDRIRARLAAAGLIDTPVAPPASLTSDQRAAFEEARSRTAGGTPGSALIAAERAGR